MCAGVGDEIKWSMQARDFDGKIVFSFPNIMGDLLDMYVYNQHYKLVILMKIVSFFLLKMIIRY